MKIFSLRILILTVLLAIGAAGALVVSSTPASAQDPHQKAIMSRDLPENAEVSFDGYVHDFTKISHPLNTAEVLDSKHEKFKGSVGLYDYSSVYMFTSVLRDQQAFVGHWLYVYQSPEQAQKAAELFLRELENDVYKTTERYHGTSNNKALTGEVFSVISFEDGVEIFWFVATDGNILSLAMVDGLDSETNQEVLRTIFAMQES